MTKYLHLVVMPTKRVECDFCVGTDQVWASYQADDFVIDKEDGWVNESKGAWAACKTCSDLIDAEQWDKLLDRSVASFKQKYKADPPGLRKSIGKVHELFRKHMRRSA